MTRDHRGASAVEYALLVAAVAVVLIFVAPVFRELLGDIFRATLPPSTIPGT